MFFCCCSIFQSKTLLDVIEIFVQFYCLSLYQNDWFPFRQSLFFVLLDQENYKRILCGQGKNGNKATGKGAYKPTCSCGMKLQRVLLSYVAPGHYSMSQGFQGFGYKAISLQSVSLLIKVVSQQSLINSIFIMNGI